MKKITIVAAGIKEIRETMRILQQEHIHFECPNVKKLWSIPLKFIIDQEGLTERQKKHLTLHLGKRTRSD